MTNDTSSLWKIKQNIELYLQQQIKNFGVVLKPTSKLMKFLSYVLFFNKGFWSFFTTIYPKIYSPYEMFVHDTPEAMKNYMIALCHEGQHLLDRKKYNVFFNLAYLAPQFFVLFTILSFFNLWFLICLIFIAPLPSIGRFIIEDRGYKVSFAVTYWVYGAKRSVDNTVAHFSNADYYFMFPFKKFLRNRFERWYVKVVSGTDLGFCERWREFFVK